MCFSSFEALNFYPLIGNIGCSVKYIGYQYPKFLKIFLYLLKIRSTLFISNSKGLSEILRDIHTSTYQICRIEKKIIRTTTFNKYMCNWTLEVRDILNILWKSGEIAP